MGSPSSAPRFLWIALSHGAALVACRNDDQASPRAADAIVLPAAPNALSLDVRRTSPRLAADRASLLEITLPLDRWRVVPVVADHAGALDALAPPNAVAGINGGYFDARERPVGLRRIAGLDRSPAWSDASGGVLALEGSRAYIGPRAQIPFVPESAVQSKPLLVEADGRSGIVADDGRRAARTTVCDAGDGALHFVLFLAGPGDGLTLYEVAQTLRAPRSRGGFACRAAINLDGGPSTGAWFAAATKMRSELPRGPVVDGLFVVPR